MALATLAVLAAFDGSWAVALILALGAAGMAPLTVASFRRLQMLKSRQF
jgi:hypothetical protein